MTSEKEILLGRLQEIEEESKRLTTKIQAIKTFVDGHEFKEATLFDHVEDKPILVPADAAPKKTRERIKDGTMTADMIAHRLFKESGRIIPRESIIKVAKSVKAMPTYCARQHVSRYSPDAVKTIMDIFRQFISL